MDGADVPVSSTGRRMWLPDGRRMVLPDIINPGFAELAEDAAYVEEDE